MRYLTITIIILTFFGCRGKKENSILRESINLKNQDSVYILSNGMKINILKGTFDNQGDAKLIVIPIKQAQDVIENELTTVTISGKHLSSQGMIYIEFLDKNDIKISPKKEYTIALTNYFVNTNGSRIFKGEKSNDDGIKWQEVNYKSKTTKLDFKDHLYTSSQGWIGPHVNGNLLSDKLDSLFKNRNLYDCDKMKGQIIFERKGQQLIFKQIIWNKKRYKVFEEDLIVQINSLGPISSLFEEYNFKIPTESISFEIIDLFQNEDVSSFSTFNTGWFNFDKYVNSPIATLKVIEIKEKPEWVYLISNNYERAIRKKFMKNDEIKFELPIDELRREFTLYTVDKYFQIISSKEIILEQGKSKEIRI